MKATPYLNFPGNCREAFTFYADCLGGNLTILDHGDSPQCDQTPADWHDKVMHANLEITEFMLMGCDAPPDMFAPAAGMSVALSLESNSDAERIFSALADGGNIGMPMAPTFWAARFGTVTDRFGIPWMVNSFEGMDMSATCSAPTD